MKRLRWIGPPALLLALASTMCADGAPPPGIEGEVAEVERAFAQAMADGDFGAFASFLSDEATFVDGTTVRKGKQAVADYWQNFFNLPEAPFSWAPETVTVLESGTLALSSGPVWDDDGNRTATFTSIWRLEDPGVWRIVFDKGDRHCDAG